MAVQAASVNGYVLVIVTCRTHGKQNDSGRLVLGRIDGDISEPKYQEFVKRIKK